MHRSSCHQQWKAAVASGARVRKCEWALTSRRLGLLLHWLMAASWLQRCTCFNAPLNSQSLQQMKARVASGGRMSVIVRVTVSVGRRGVAAASLRPAEGGDARINS